jgi:Tfp pilus assembly protein PilX
MVRHSGVNDKRSMVMPSRPPKHMLRTVPNSEHGFVLPLVLGVGVLTMLLGMMMIERSSQNRIAAIAQKANAQSVAVAEQGITQFQSLLNRYRSLATACSDASLSTTCGSNLWQNLPNAVLDPCSTDSTEPITKIQSYANRDWQNSTSQSADGQFRLISYEYKPDLTMPEAIGTGTLVVEGRINPDDAIRTATTQLKVNFNVTRGPHLGTPGLWIQDNQAAGASGSVQLLTQVHDSTCSEGAAASSIGMQQIQRQIQAPYVYQATPGIAFPQLPSEGSIPAVLPSTPEITTVAPIARPVVALPKPTEPPLGAVPGPKSNHLVYRIQAKGSGSSINLTDATDILEIGTDSETVVLHLEGGITVTGGAKIRLAPNAKLIVYAHGPVNLEGNGTTPAIEQQGTPSATRVQLYVYPPQLSSAPPYNVSLSKNSAPLYLSLLAPTSKVTSSAKIQGNIWAKSWEGTDTAVITQDNSSNADLQLLWPPHISPITAWQENS